MAVDTEPEPEWVTVQEVARHYRVASKTVLRWVATDPTMKVRRLGPTGRIIRIHRSELNRDTSLSASA
jgi:DNA integrity scanning protein DisA with diadenylate cyclase activity